MRTLMFVFSVLVVVATTADAQDLTWRKDIQPILQANCTRPSWIQRTHLRGVEPRPG